MSCSLRTSTSLNGWQVLDLSPRMEAMASGGLGRGTHGHKDGLGFRTRRRLDMHTSVFWSSFCVVACQILASHGIAEVVQPSQEHAESTAPKGRPHLTMCSVSQLNQTLSEKLVSFSPDVMSRAPTFCKTQEFESFATRGSCILVAKGKFTRNAAVCGRFVAGVVAIWAIS